MIGIRFWGWSKDDCLSILTEHIPNPLCIIWECMPLVITETWAISKICTMDLDVVKGLVNVINSGVIGGIRVMVRKEVMFIDPAIDDIACFTSIL